MVVHKCITTYINIYFEDLSVLTHSILQHFPDLRVPVPEGIQKFGREI